MKTVFVLLDSANRNAMESKDGVPMEVQGLTIEDTQTALFDLHADPVREEKFN